MQEHIFEDRIYYRTNNFEPNRLTLVFIHGVAGSSSAWWPYEKIFNNDYQNKYNILTYDLRGHGKSKKFQDYPDYEIKYFVNDLFDLLTHLNISKFVLISNSFGGLVHLEYLKLYRESVVANIFTSPEIYMSSGFLAKTTRPVLRLLSQIINLLSFNPKPRGHVDYNKHIGSTDWDISRNLADMRNTGLHAHFYTLEQSFNHCQEYSLEKINVPTLIIHGEKDSMVPLQNSIMMSQKIKNSQFISVPNIDHNTVHNAEGVLSEAIDSFLEKNKNVLK